MINYNGIDFLKGININKISMSKRSIICYRCYFQASSLALNQLSATTATYQCYLFTRTKLLLLKVMVLILALSFGICGSLQDIKKN